MIEKTTTLLEPEGAPVFNGPMIHQDSLLFVSMDLILEPKDPILPMFDQASLVLELTDPILPKIEQDLPIFEPVIPVIFLYKRNDI